MTHMQNYTCSSFLFSSSLLSLLSKDVANCCPIGPLAPAYSLLLNRDLYPVDCASSCLSLSCCWYRARTLETGLTGSFTRSVLWLDELDEMRDLGDLGSLWKLSTFLFTESVWLFECKGDFIEYNCGTVSCVCFGVSKFVTTGLKDFVDSELNFDWL